MLQATVFRVDVTPPLGDGPCVGAMPKVESIEHPLELRGVIWRTDQQTWVTAAIDYCGICNSSDFYLRTAMAQAANTSVERVALQSLHQHTAPILDADAVSLLYGETSTQLTAHRQFTEEIARRTRREMEAALAKLQPVTRIVGARSKVERVASNRRVPLSDGSIGVRASLTRDPAIRDAPEGLIDPWLRTLTVFNGNSRLVQIHYYATHPQSFYGDGRISWDTVGIARDRFEKESGVFQIYFTGCAGNIALGKYNEGTREARSQIAERIDAGMRLAGKAVGPEIDIDVNVAALPPAAIRWDTAPVKFTVREQGAFDPETLRRQLEPSQPFSVRLTAAMFSGFAQSLRRGYVGTVTRLRIGPVEMVHLPGEPFIEFQLFAQTLADPQAFVCVAGYGECGVWYYGPDQIYHDRGGYEQTWSLTGPCQESVESALRAVLKR